MEAPGWTSYERMGRSFLDRAASSPYNRDYERAAMMDAIGPVQGLSILDAGCGPGLYLREFVGAGAELTGFDGSPKMVRLARQQLGQNARLGIQDLEGKLSYDDQEFDIVICALVIHHVQNTARALCELRRVLKEGGRLYLSTNHPTSDWVRKGGSYFAETVETDIWKMSTGDTFSIPFKRMPLSSLVGIAHHAGLAISRIIEPRPNEHLKVDNPTLFERLETLPAFIILELIPSPSLLRK